MKEEDVQALRTTGIVLLIGVFAGLWGLFNGWFPESFAAPARSVVILAVKVAGVVLVVLFVLRIVARARGARVRTRNSPFASFMGSNWNGKKGISVTRSRGKIVKVTVKLPPTQPLYDANFQDRITQAARTRMNEPDITAHPDAKRHTITFTALNEAQKGELSRVRENRTLSAAFSAFMPSDWDKESGISWQRDPRVTATASHGYTGVRVTLAGRWSLADEDVQRKLRAIAAAKLGSENIEEKYDAVRNTAEFTVFTMTAEMVADRNITEKVTDLEENFRGFFSKPVKATVHDWDQATGDPLKFTLKYEPQRGDYLDSFAQKLEHGASRKMGRRMVATLRPKSREIDFEPRAELASLITHPGISLYAEQKSKRVLLHLGENASGGITSWELSANSAQPHAIFAGATRSGKSASMRNVVLGCAWYGIEMVCLDPKYKEFLAYQQFPNVRSVATSTEKIAETIAFVHDRIMEPRYKIAALAKLEGKREPEFPPFVMLIDEYIVLVRELTAWWKSIKEKSDPAVPPELEMMTKMLVKAAGANVHILMGMQRMDVEFIPGAARDQVSFRLALGQISPTLANMAFDNYFAGVGMPLLQGRGLANPDGVLSEVQVFKVDEPANEDTPDQDINKAFLERARELEKSTEWITPKGMFDTDLAAEVNSALLRAAAESTNPPPPADKEATPVHLDDLEIPVVSTGVGTIVTGDTIRNPDGQIGTVTDVEEVQIGDEWGVEISALFGSEVMTETYTEDSVIDRVDVIPEEDNEKEKEAV